MFIIVHCYRKLTLVRAPKIQQRVNRCLCQALFTHSDPVTDPVTVKFYHCTYGDRPSDRQNGCETHSAGQTARHIGTMMSL